MTEKAAEADKVIDKNGATSSASDDRVLAALCTIPIVGLIVYFVKTDASDFVKNYARQGAVLFIVSIIVSIIGAIPFIGFIVCLLGPALFILWIILLVKALGEEKDYQLPLIGDIAKSIFK